MLILKSQLCNFISSTTLTFCLCNFQISSELAHSEGACFFFHLSIKYLLEEKNPKDLPFNRKQVVQCLIPLPAV